MVIPFLLLAMLVGSALSAEHPFFLVLLLLQTAAYVTVPLALVVKGRLRKLLAVQYYLLMNVALVVGYWRYLFRREGYWKKTPRVPHGDNAESGVRR
jgi:hypothetical protein